MNKQIAALEVALRIAALRAQAHTEAAASLKGTKVSG
jgi:hypothetical protein